MGKTCRPITSGGRVGVGPLHVHPGVPGHARHPPLSAMPKKVTTGPISLVVGFGVGLGVTVRVGVRVLVGERVGVSVGVSVAVRVGV